MELEEAVRVFLDSFADLSKQDELLDIVLRASELDDFYFYERENIKPFQFSNYVCSLEEMKNTEENYYHPVSLINFLTLLRGLKNKSCSIYFEEIGKWFNDLEELRKALLIIKLSGLK